MARVLLVDCPASTAGALPDGAFVVAPEPGKLLEAAFRPDLVVIGSGASRPEASAQDAARTYPKVDVLIATRGEEVARLRQLLAITPSIPLRTDLVAEEPVEAMALAIRRAVERCDLRNGHRRVLQSVGDVLARSFPSTLGASTPDASRPDSSTVGTPRSGEAFAEIARALAEPRSDTRYPPWRPSGSTAGTGFPHELAQALQQEFESSAMQSFLTFYDGVRDDVGVDVNRVTSTVKAATWPLREPEPGSVADRPSLAALERGLGEGRVQPYVERLKQVGATHAEAGLGFGEWLVIARHFRRSVTERLLRDVLDEPQHEVLRGLESFLHTTLVELEGAHSEAREALMRRSEIRAQLFAVAVESSDDAILTTSPGGEITAQNPAAERLYGHSAAEALRSRLVDWACPEDRAALTEQLSRAASGEGIGRVEITLDDARKRHMTIELSVSPVSDADGAIVGLSVISRDLSEQKRAEVSLRQSQKMQAVGRLAGGVAHDFNNLLTVILAHASLLLETMEELAPANDGDWGVTLESVNEIMTATERARALTHQLLTFSHRRPVQPQVVNVADAVRSTHQMIRRTFPTNVEISVLLGDDSWPVHIDSNQLSQLLMNLALNARDAMPGGGRLGIEVGGERAPRPRGELPSGDYVVLRVSDTGVGIAADDLGQIFDPFFTTKPSGKGTGLGLANCYSIARQAGGDIEVNSQPGVGTTFAVWLPHATTAAEPIAIADGAGSVNLHGAETILVVEDDSSVRAAVTSALHRYGYRTLEAPNGDVALRLLEGHSGRVDLVLTDTVMPQMSGPELAERLASLHPALPVLLMTGYADEASLRHRGLDANGNVLLKPFIPSELVARVRQLLDR